MCNLFSLEHPAVRTMDPLFAVLPFRACSCLNTGETILCWAGHVQFVLVGTSRGRVLLLDTDGNPVAIYDNLHGGQVLCLHLFESATGELYFVSGGEDGVIMCCDWLTNTRCVLATSDGKIPVTSIALPQSFSLSDRHFFYGNAAGSLFVQQQRLLRFSQTLLWTNVRESAAGSFLSSLFGSKAATGAPPPQAAAKISDLSLFSEVLVFWCDGALHFFHSRKGTHIGRLFSNKPTTSCKAVMLHEMIVFHLGTRIFFVDLNAAVNKYLLNVTRVFEMGENVTALAIFDQSLLVVQSSETSQTQLVKLALFKKFPSKELRDVIQFPFTTTESIKGTMSFSSPAVESSVVLMTSSGFASVRSLFIPEKVEFLVTHKQFDKAIQLCDKMRRRREMIEVVDWYAQQLWHNPDTRRQSMALWGENILPLAPQSFWMSFVRRLQRQNLLPLLEVYLPFNNPQLLTAKTYSRILEHYLQNGQFRSFYDRISKWPVVYSLAQMQDTILRLIHKQRGSASHSLSLSLPMLPNKEHTPTFEELDESVIEKDPRHLYMALFKLCEFQNNFFEALRVLASMRSSATIEYFEAHQIWKSFKILPEERKNASKIREKESLLLLVTHSESHSRHHILSLFAKHRQDISMHDVSQLLESYPLGQMIYLEMCFADDKIRTAPFHHTLLSLYFDALAEAPSDELRQKIVRMLSTSNYYNMAAERQRCLEHNLSEGVAVIDQRMAAGDLAQLLLTD
eukprot:TRINITY_DN9589_c0_g1_i1.p1 TRINITY_DN9589_c0_g1~~TRINITY_DN9589_c0_g1_i1.p1  ORF type:complete len:737 (+),score=125.08 TRINITY_DN9589_c0_g1_i1:113-2323(+)